MAEAVTAGEAGAAGARPWNSPTVRAACLVAAGVAHEVEGEAEVTFAAEELGIWGRGFTSTYHPTRIMETRKH